MGFQVAYVPIGVGTFHLESAQDQFEKSIAMLKGLNADCTVPEKMLLTINDLDAYLDTLNPDLIVLQNITFANAAYASEVLKRFDVNHRLLPPSKGFPVFFSLWKGGWKSSLPAAPASAQSPLCPVPDNSAAGSFHGTASAACE